ncbi:MAG: DNA repair exonuclease [Halanaerobiales bacterium]
MALKILHTGDIHLGRKFSHYNDELSKKLEEVRYETLMSIVKEANDRSCNLLVFAGDLFDKITMPDKDIVKALDILDKFSGDAILVLPGNHDNKNIDAWKTFKENIHDRILFLEEEKIYDLNRFDLDIDIYPAPCDSKHSSENKLQWIKGVSERNNDNYEIGIAHGAIKGVSPDMTDSYFNMSKSELRSLNLDLWLLGHTHIPIPTTKENNVVFNKKIYNAGTPEPDGFDCRHKGFVWYIEMNSKEDIKAELIKTGKYSFEELNKEIKTEEDLNNLLEGIKSNNPENKLIRLDLYGRIDQAIHNKKNEYYNKIEDITFYARINDDDLNLKITKEKIKEEFSEGSFPFQFLNELMGEDKTLEIAYELIQEVKE